MKNRSGNSPISYYTYLSVLLGAVLGSTVFLLLLLTLEIPVLDQGLEDYKIGAVLNLPTWQLLVYVLKRRLGQIILFSIICILFSYPIAAGCYSLCFGTYYAMIMCNLFIKFGIHGILYSIVCFFPHYFFYFLSIYCLGKWFYDMEEKKKYCYGNVNKLQYFVKIFVIFFMIFIAIIWEIKFQKNILNYFYQYLV